MRRVVAVLAFAPILIGLVAPAAAADTPTFPPVGPYQGCTDWYLQDWYPMSPDDAQWAFTCTQEGSVDGVYWFQADEYYWNADSSQIVAFATSYYEEGGWYYYVNTYNCSSGCAYDA